MLFDITGDENWGEYKDKFAGALANAVELNTRLHGPNVDGAAFKTLFGATIGDPAKDAVYRKALFDITGDRNWGTYKDKFVGALKPAADFYELLKSGAIDRVAFRTLFGTDIADPAKDGDFRKLLFDITGDENWDLYKEKFIPRLPLVAELHTTLLANPLAQAAFGRLYPVSFANPQVDSQYRKWLFDIVGGPKFTDPRDYVRVLMIADDLGVKLQGATSDQQRAFGLVYRQQVIDPRQNDAFRTLLFNLAGDPQNAYGTEQGVSNFIENLPEVAELMDDKNKNLRQLFELPDDIFHRVPDDPERQQAVGFLFNLALNFVGPTRRKRGDVEVGKLWEMGAETVGEYLEQADAAYEILKFSRVNPRLSQRFFSQSGVLSTSYRNIDFSSPGNIYSTHLRLLFNLASQINQIGRPGFYSDVTQLIGTLNLAFDLIPYYEAYMGSEGGNYTYVVNPNGTITQNPDRDNLLKFAGEMRQRGIDKILGLGLNNGTPQPLSSLQQSIRTLQMRHRGAVRLDNLLQLFNLYKLDLPLADRAKILELEKAMSRWRLPQGKTGSIGVSQEVGLMVDAYLFGDEITKYHYQSLGQEENPDDPNSRRGRRWVDPYTHQGITAYYDATGLVEKSIVDGRTGKITQTFYKDGGIPVRQVGPDGVETTYESRVIRAGDADFSAVKQLLDQSGAMYDPTEDIVRIAHEDPVMHQLVVTYQTLTGHPIAERQSGLAPNAPQRISIALDSNSPLTREVWLLQNGRAPVKQFTYAQREMPSLFGASAERNAWSYIEVNNHQTQVPHIELVDAQGLVREVITGLEGSAPNVGSGLAPSRHRTWTVVEYDDYSREKGRRKFRLPSTLLPGIQNGAYVLDGWEEMEVATRETINPDGTIGVNVQDLLRHTVRREVYDGSARVSLSVGTDVTTFDLQGNPLETRRNNALWETYETATFDNLTAQEKALLAEYGVTTTPRVKFIRALDVQGNARLDAYEEDEKVITITVRDTQKVESSFFKGQIIEISVPHYGPDGLDDSAALETRFVAESGSTIIHRTAISDLWRERDTGAIHLRLGNPSGPNTYRIADANGQVLLEFTADHGGIRGPDNLTITLINPEDQSRATYTLRSDVRLDAEGANRERMLNLKALQALALDGTVSKQTSGSEAPTVNPVTGEATSVGWALQLTDEGEKRLSHTETRLGKYLLERTAGNLRTRFDPTQPFESPVDALDVRSEKVRKTFKAQVTRAGPAGQPEEVAIETKDAQTGLTESDTYDLTGHPSRNRHTVRDPNTNQTSVSRDVLDAYGLSLYTEREEGDGIRNETLRTYVESLDPVTRRAVTREENLRNSKQTRRLVDADGNVLIEAELNGQGTITFFDYDEDSQPRSAISFDGYNGEDLRTLEKPNRPHKSRTEAPRIQSDQSIEVDRFDAHYDENGKFIYEQKVTEHRTRLGRLLTETIVDGADTYVSTYDPAWSMALPINKSKNGQVIGQSRVRGNPQDASFNWNDVHIDQLNSAGTLERTERYGILAGHIGSYVEGTENGRPAIQTTVPLKMFGVEIGADVHFGDENGPVIERYRDLETDADGYSRSRHEMMSSRGAIKNSETVTFDPAGRPLQIVTAGRITKINQSQNSSQTFAKRSDSETGEKLIDSSWTADGKVRTDLNWDNSAVGLKASAERVFLNSFGRPERSISWNGSNILSGDDLNGASFLVDPEAEYSEVQYRVGAETGRTTALVDFALNGGQIIRSYQNQEPGSRVRSVRDFQKFDSYTEELDEFGRQIKEVRGSYEMRIEYEGQTGRRAVANLYKKGSEVSIMTWETLPDQPFEQVRRSLNIREDDRLRLQSALHLSILTSTLIRPVRVTTPGGVTYGATNIEYRVAGDLKGRAFATFSGNEKLFVDKWLPGTNLAVESRMLDINNNSLQKRFRAIPRPISDYFDARQQRNDASLLMSELLAASAVEIEEFAGDEMRLQSKRIALFQFIPIANLKSGLQQDGRTLDFAPGASLDVIRYEPQSPWVKAGQDTYEWVGNQIGRKIFTADRVSDLRNIGLMESAIRSRGFSEAADDLGNVEVYDVKALANDEKTPVKNWQSVYRKNSDREIVKWDLDSQRLSVNLFDGPISVAGIEFDYENQSLGDVMGLAMVLEDSDNGRRQVYVLDAKLKLGIIEQRDINDGTVESRIDLYYRALTKAMTEERVGRIIANLMSGDFVSSKINLLDGAIQLSLTNHAFRNFEDYQAVHLRRLNIPTAAKTFLAVDQNSYKIDRSAFAMESTTESDIGQLSIGEAGVRIETIRQTMIPINSALGDWVRYAVEVRDGLGQKIETYLGETTGSTARERFENFRAELKFREFFLRGQRPDGKVYLGKNRVPDKGVVTLIINGQEYVQALSNSAVLFTNGNISYRTRRGQGQLVQLDANGAQAYQQLQEEVLNGRIGIDKQDVSEGEIKDARGHLLVGLDGFAAADIGEDGFVREGANPKFITFHNHNLPISKFSRLGIQRPEIEAVFFHVGLSPISYRYFYDNSLDQSKYQRLDDEGRLVEPGGNWLSKTEHGGFKLENDVNGAPVKVMVFNVQSHEETGMNQSMHRLDGRLLKDIFLHFNEGEPDLEKTTYDAFEQPVKGSLVNPGQDSYGLPYAQYHVTYPERGYKTVTKLGPSSGEWVPKGPLNKLGDNVVQAVQGQGAAETVVLENGSKTFTHKSRFISTYGDKTAFAPGYNYFRQGLFGKAVAPIIDPLMWWSTDAKMAYSLSQLDFSDDVARLQQEHRSSSHLNIFQEIGYWWSASWLAKVLRTALSMFFAMYAATVFRYRKQKKTPKRNSVVDAVPEDARLSMLLNEFSNAAHNKFVQMELSTTDFETFDNHTMSFARFLISRLSEIKDESGEHILPTVEIEQYVKDARDAIRYDRQSPTQASQELTKALLARAYAHRIQGYMNELGISLGQDQHVFSRDHLRKDERLQRIVLKQLRKTYLLEWRKEASMDISRGPLRIVRPSPRGWINVDLRLEVWKKGLELHLGDIDLSGHSTFINRLIEHVAPLERSQRRDAINIWSGFAFQWLRRGLLDHAELKDQNKKIVMPNRFVLNNENFADIFKYWSLGEILANEWITKSELRDSVDYTSGVNPPAHYSDGTAAAVGRHRNPLSEEDLRVIASRFESPLRREREREGILLPGETEDTPLSVRYPSLAFANYVLRLYRKSFIGQLHPHYLFTFAGFYRVLLLSGVVIGVKFLVLNVVRGFPGITGNPILWILPSIVLALFSFLLFRPSAQGLRTAVILAAISKWAANSYQIRKWNSRWLNNSIVKVLPSVLENQNYKAEFLSVIDDLYQNASASELTYQQYEQLKSVAALSERSAMSETLRKIKLSRDAQDSLQFFVNQKLRYDLPQSPESVNDIVDTTAIVTTLDEPFYIDDVKSASILARHKNYKRNFENFIARLLLESHGGTFRCYVLGQVVEFELSPEDIRLMASWARGSSPSAALVDMLSEDENVKNPLRIILVEWFNANMDTAYRTVEGVLLMRKELGAQLIRIHPDLQANEAYSLAEEKFQIMFLRQRLLSEDLADRKSAQRIRNYVSRLQNTSLTTLDLSLSRGERTTRGAKYAANWAVAMPRAEGELLLTLDKDHSIERARIVEFWRVSRMFDNRPRLGLGPYLMGAYNKKMSLEAFALGEGEDVWTEAEGEAKPRVGALSVYGKILGRREVLLSDYGLARPDDNVAEDVVTGMGAMNEGWETDHITGFQIDQSQPAEFEGSKNPQQKYSQDPHKAITGMTGRRFFANPNIPPNVKHDTLYSFAHYHVLLPVVGAIGGFFWGGYTQPYNPFFILPALDGFFVGFGLAEAINLLLYAHRAMHRGLLVAIPETIWIMVRIAPLHIALIPVQLQAWLTGAASYEKFIPTKTGEMRSQRPARVVYDLNKPAMILGAIVLTGLLVAPFHVFPIALWLLTFSSGIIWISAAHFFNYASNEPLSWARLTRQIGGIWQSYIWAWEDLAINPLRFALYGLRVHFNIKTRALNFANRIKSPFLIHYRVADIIAVGLPVWIGLTFYLSPRFASMMLKSGQWTVVEITNIAVTTATMVAVGTLPYLISRAPKIFGRRFQIEMTHWHPVVAAIATIFTLVTIPLKLVTPENLNFLGYSLHIWQAWIMTALYSSAFILTPHADFLPSANPEAASHLKGLQLYEKSVAALDQARSWVEIRLGTRRNLLTPNEFDNLNHIFETGYRTARTLDPSAGERVRAHRNVLEIITAAKRLTFTIEERLKTFSISHGTLRSGYRTINPLDRQKTINSLQDLNKREIPRLIEDLRVFTADVESILGEENPLPGDREVSAYRQKIRKNLLLAWKIQLDDLRDKASSVTSDLEMDQIREDIANVDYFLSKYPDLVGWTEIGRRLVALKSDFGEQIPPIPAIVGSAA